MAFDPAANGAVPFDPAANGAVAFDPSQHAAPAAAASASLPWDVPITGAQADKQQKLDAQNEAEDPEPSEPGFKHLMWTMRRPFVTGGQTAQGTRPIPTGVAALEQAAPAAGIGDFALPSAAAAGLPKSGMVKSLSDRILSGRLPENVDPEGMASTIRSDMRMQDASPSTAGGVKAPTTTQANMAKTTLASRLEGARSELVQNKHITPEQGTQLDFAIESARRNNNSLDTGPGSAYARIKDWNLPEDVTTSLQEHLQDLDTLSTQSFKKNETGPLTIAGSAVGRVGPAIAAFATGHPIVGAELLAVGGVGAKAGAKIGTAADRLFGLNTPTLTLAAQAARRNMIKQGLDPALIRPSPMAAIPGRAAELPAGGRTPGFIGGGGKAGVINPAEVPSPTPGFIRPEIAHPSGPAPARDFIRPAIPQEAQAAPAPGFIRPTIPQEAPATPAPAFIRPAITQPTPQPAPGFIRPAITEPTPQPAPGFIRPDVAQPTPQPAPGFIRPTVEAPQSAPAAPPPPGGTALIERMKRQAEARAQANQAMSAGQPDPATGLPSNPVPVNTPIPSGFRAPSGAQVPTGGSNLPRLVPDTPSGVANTLTAEGAPPSQLTPGGKYAVWGGFARDQAHAVEVANAAAKAGALSPQEVTQVASGVAPLMPEAAARFRKFATDQQTAALGIKPSLIDRGVAQARVNAEAYQANARHMATLDPAAAPAIMEVASIPKLSAKQARAAQLEAADPSLKGKLNFLLNQGGKD